MNIGTLYPMGDKLNALIEDQSLLNGATVELCYVDENLMT